MNESNKSAPSFSVVIPLFNKARYIRRAVDSVLNQTLKNLELIVVDDGSTDNSFERLTGITDSRLRVHRQQNTGVGAARSFGMSLAGARWIALLDADDMWLPNHLRELEKLHDR